MNKYALIKQFKGEKLFLKRYNNDPRMIGYTNDIKEALVLTNQSLLEFIKSPDEELIEV